METKWLDWAKELQAIAQTGLTYSKDIYDVERFEQIRQISMEMMAQQTNVDMATIKDLFANETGYATPKVDVRAVVFQDGKILMVKEKSDGGWALPGGWADIGLSPGEVAVKEVKEEAGVHVKPVKLLGVFDKKRHPHPPRPHHVYKIFLQCEMISGELMGGVETSAVAFFGKSELPKLSIDRNTESQIQRMFQYAEGVQEPGYFD